MQWIKLTDRMPNPDEHGRVLIYTEGYDFSGEQVFDVKAETLNECFYSDSEDQPEVCKHASHWAAHPSNAALHNAALHTTEIRNSSQPSWIQGGADALLLLVFDALLEADAPTIGDDGQELSLPEQIVALAARSKSRDVNDETHGL